MIDTIRQFELVAIPTSGACLRSVGRIHFNTSNTGPCCLVLDELKELPPRYIADRTIHAAKVVFFHVVDREILNNDGVKLVYELSGFLMSKVFAFPRNALMHAGNNLARLRARFRTFCLFGKFTLRRGKVFLFLLEKARVLDLRAVGPCGKRFKTHIEADSRVNRLLDWFTIYDARKSYVPFPGCGTSNGTGFDLPFDGSVEFDLNIAYLGKPNRVFKKFEPGLGIGKRIVSELSPEPGVAWFFSRFNTAEECAERKVDPCRNILKALTEYIVQKSVFFFQVGQRVCLPIPGKTLFFGFPRSFTLFEEVIVKPTTGLQRLVKFCRLRLIRKYPVFEGLPHNVYTINHGVYNIKHEYSSFFA